jgi:hypothetical protein
MNQALVQLYLSVTPGMACGGTPRMDRPRTSQHGDERADCASWDAPGESPNPGGWIDDIRLGCIGSFCRTRFNAPLLGCGGLKVSGLRDGRS